MKVMAGVVVLGEAKGIGARGYRDPRMRSSPRLNLELHI